MYLMIMHLLPEDREIYVRQKYTHFSIFRQDIKYEKGTKVKYIFGENANKD